MTDSLLLNILFTLLVGVWFFVIALYWKYINISQIIYGDGDNIDYDTSELQQHIEKIISENNYNIKLNTEELREFIILTLLQALQTKEFQEYLDSIKTNKL